MSVVSSALGGLIVAAVLKYADSVLKGYATAASVILTGWLSVVFFGTTLDLHFVLAMVTVICSIFLYSDKGVAPAEKPAVPRAHRQCPRHAGRIAHTREARTVAARLHGSTGEISALQ